MRLLKGYNGQGELIFYSTGLAVSNAKCGSPTTVCKQHKSLYRLKQAPEKWFAKLTFSLIAFGFTQSKADYSLFTKQTAIGYIIVLVYIDDMLILRSNEHLLQQLKHHLNKWFHMKDLGELRYFLGIEVAQSNEGIFLT